MHLDIGGGWCLHLVTQNGPDGVDPAEAASGRLDPIKPLLEGGRRTEQHGVCAPCCFRMGRFPYPRNRVDEHFLGESPPRRGMALWTARDGVRLASREGFVFACLLWTQADNRSAIGRNGRPRGCAGFSEGAREPSGRLSRRRALFSGRAERETLTPGQTRNTPLGPETPKRDH